MMIDFHTHCFPEKIAGRAIESLSTASGGLIPQTDGTVESLLLHMDACGVDKSVVLNIATNAHQQTAVNDFAARINGARIVSFGSVYPFAPDALEELERIKQLGLRGVKLHPEYQGFFVDDPRMKPIYRKISELGLIVTFYAGEDYGYDTPYHATPERLRTAAKWLDAPMIAAHWGSAGMGAQVLEFLCDTPVYFDTSFGYGTAPRERFRKIIDRHGTDKILFGSDCPWHSPAWELRLLSTLGLTASELEAILSGNAERLLGLTP